MSVDKPTQLITCPQCSRTVAINPYNGLTIHKHEQNAGHAMVLGSDITCACGKVL